MSEEYNEEKWKKICGTTLNNYIYMEKRLSSRKKFSDFILVYYSIFLIINSLTVIYFECYNSHLAEYFGIIISIVVLAYSLINSNANYGQRILTVTKAINDLKTLKREKIDNIKSFKDSYDSIVDNVEFRSDEDFFMTVTALCKEKNFRWFWSSYSISVEDDEEIIRIKNYLSEISPRVLQFKIILKMLLRCCLIVLPIIVLTICFIIEH